MAECCTEVKTELEKLRAEIARIKIVDENTIIQKSVKLSESSILPQIGTAISGLAVAIYSRYDPGFDRFKVDLSNIGNLARTANNTADDASLASRLATDRSNGADRKAGQAIDDVVKNTRELELTKASVVLPKAHR